MKWTERTNLNETEKLLLGVVRLFHAKLHSDDFKDFVKCPYYPCSQTRDLCGPCQKCKGRGFYIDDPAMLGVPVRIECACQRGILNPSAPSDNLEVSK